MLSRLKSKGQTTIPAAIRRRLQLTEGTLLDWEVDANKRIVITVKEVKDRDPDQAWFWTPEWQEKEREADEELKAGRFMDLEILRHRYGVKGRPLFGEPGQPVNQIT